MLSDTSIDADVHPDRDRCNVFDYSQQLFNELHRPAMSPPASFTQLVLSSGLGKFSEANVRVASVFSSASAETLKMIVIACS